jgi:hypothetical protein
LYDHRGELPEDFTHLETVNLLRRSKRVPGVEKSASLMRQAVIDFIKYRAVFRGCYK